MKISFDFDSTLTVPYIRRLASKYIEEGHTVRVTTSRYDCTVPILGQSGMTFSNNDVFELMEIIGISEVVFTNGEFKYKFLEGFDIHYDDDEYEISEINNNLNKCIGVRIR